MRGCAFRCAAARVTALAGGLRLVAQPVLVDELALVLQPEGSHYGNRGGSTHGAWRAFWRLAWWWFGWRWARSPPGVRSGVAGVGILRG